jgi:hypothetical protein
MQKKLFYAKCLQTTKVPNVHSNLGKRHAHYKVLVKKSSIHKMLRFAMRLLVAIIIVKKEYMEDDV